ncbi:MAG TPA: hypothetical protein VM490_21700 [Armatimonadaceae bacterium]|nr:hypothetical protein [Armatimonadaceae bacterium]
MGFLEFIVAVVFITTVGKVLGAIFSKGMPPPQQQHNLPPYVGHGSSAADRAYLDALAGEVRALRAEVEQLRASRNAPVSGGGGSLPREVAERVNALSDEVHSLRDTSTQFDMTFDAALDRLERRLERVEEGRQQPQQQGAQQDAAAARWYTGSEEREAAAQQQIVGQR